MWAKEKIKEEEKNCVRERLWWQRRERLKLKKELAVVRECVCGAEKKNEERNKVAKENCNFFSVET